MGGKPNSLESELTPEELSLLLSCVHSRSLTGKHLEIGTAAGGTLKELMLSYTDESRPKFVSVDTMDYYADQLMVIRDNLAAAGINPDSVEFRKSRSWNALQVAISKNERFSLIFIDGSHKIKHVTEDIGWANLLDPGGVICFHDYSELHPGVVSAVDRFNKKCPEYKSIGRAGSLIAFEKLRPSSRKETETIDRVRAYIISFIWQNTHSLKKLISR